LFLYILFIDNMYIYSIKASPYMRLDEDYAYFQNLILMHSIDRPPYSKKYFSLEQIRKITEYATNTYNIIKIIIILIIIYSII